MLANIKGIKELTVQYVEQFVQELKTLVETRNSSGNIRSGVWIENTNIVLASIAFTPHSDPEEESIEISIKIAIDSLVSIFIDMCWSDGEIIGVITKEQLEFNSLDDLNARLINILENITPTLINKMAELAIPSQLPRYRLR